MPGVLNGAPNQEKSELYNGSTLEDALWEILARVGRRLESTDPQRNYRHPRRFQHSQRLQDSGTRFLAGRRQRSLCGRRLAGRQGRHLAVRNVDANSS